MSWFLTAGGLTRILANWASTNSQTKYLMKHLLQSMERQEFERSEHQGIVKASYKWQKMADECIPGKQSIFCWHCGEIDFIEETNDYKVRGERGQAIGWSEINTRVVHSGQLCPKCNQDPKIRKYFFNTDRNIEAVARHIGDYGAHVVKDQGDTTLEKVKGWIKKAWCGGWPYETPPDSLDD